MSHLFVFGTVLTFLLQLFLFLPIHAFAENNDTLNLFELPLEELMNVQIISEVASMFPENDLEVGASVSVITSEDMKRLGVRRINDALENELAVTQNVALGGAYTTSIRGYTKKEASGVAWMIDGIPVSSPVHCSPNFQNPDWHPGTLSRIEMIKGPGSAIYGSEAFHGVTSLNTFESDKDTFSASGALAAPGYSDGDMKLSRGFFNNRIRINISSGISSQGDQDLKYAYRDTTVDPVVTGTGYRENAYDTKTGVFKIRFYPQRPVQAHLAYYNNRFDSEKFPGYVFNSLVQNLRDNDYSEHDTNMDIYSGSFSYQMNSRITLQTSAYHWNSKTQGQYAGFSYQVPEVFVQKQINSSERNTRSGFVVTLKQPENTHHLTWLIASSIETTKCEQSAGTLQMTDGEKILEITAPMPYENFSRDIKSIYGQLKWSFLDKRVYILAGGRLDSYNDLGEQFTPRMGVIYKPTMKSAVKALYGNAFNAPGAYDIYGSTVAFKGNENLKPETIDIYELVYLYRSHYFRFDLTGFYSHWEDGILMSSLNDQNDQGYLTTFLNRGKSQAYGIETKLYRKIKDFSVDMGFSWVVSENMDAEDPHNPGRTDDFKYASFPEYMILLGLSYTFTPWHVEFFMNNRIYLERKAYSLAETPIVIDPPNDLPTYYRADLTISKPFKTRYRLDLHIRNLFDRKNRIPSNYGAENGYPEPGTSGLLRLSCSF